MIRKEAFESVGGFDVNLRLLEDYKLALALSTLGDWVSIKEPLVLKYDDEDGLGVQGRKDKLNEIATVIAIIESHIDSNRPISRSARKSLRLTLSRLNNDYNASGRSTASILKSKYYRLLQKIASPKLIWDADSVNMIPHQQ